MAADLGPLCGGSACLDLVALGYWLRRGLSCRSASGMEAVPDPVTRFERCAGVRYERAAADDLVHARERVWAD